MAKIIFDDKNFTIKIVTTSNRKLSKEDLTPEQFKSDKRFEPIINFIQNTIFEFPRANLQEYEYALKFYENYITKFIRTDLQSKLLKNISYDDRRKVMKLPCLLYYIMRFNISLRETLDTF